MEEPEVAESVQADIGLVFATAIELGPMLDRCARLRKYTGGNFTFRGGRLGEIRLAFVQCGMGPVAARQATLALLDGHSPKWIISAGFSGALSETLKIGDIVVGQSLVDEQGTELRIDVGMPANPAGGLHVGRLLTVDRIVRTVTEKRELAKKSQALAVDMESLAVATACREAHARCLVVRAISDDMTADLPPEVLSIVGSTGSVRLGAAIGAIWKRPGSIMEMWHLRETAGVASKRLAVFLEGVITQLYAADH